MFGKKQPFRFRLPWGTPAPRARRPMVQTQPTSPPPTLPEAIPSMTKNASPVTSQPRPPNTELPVIPQTASPASETKIGGKKLPKSSSPSHVVTEVQSPARATIQRKQADSQPLAQEPQPMGELVSDGASSSKKLTPDENHPLPTEESPSGSQYMETNAIAVDPLDTAIHRRITTVHAEAGSRTQIKDTHMIAVEAEENSKEELNNIVKKETIEGLSTDKKHINKHSSTHPKSTTYNEEQATLYKNIKDDTFKFVHKLTNGQAKDDEKLVTVITLAGENRGATMLVDSEGAKKDANFPIHRCYKFNQDESSEAITDGEGASIGRLTKEKSKEPEEAYVNSNTQSINNSIVFNSSVAERDPGVHMDLLHIPSEPIETNSDPETLETHKAKASRLTPKVGLN